MFGFFKREKAVPAELVTPAKALTAKVDCSVRGDVTLGDKVKDKVTGFEGVATTISHEIDGTVLVGIQPRELNNGAPAEASEFDVERLEVVEKGIVALPKDGLALRESVKIGAQYRDRITGFVGTAIRRIDFLGGCTRVTLTPKVSRENRPKDSVFVAIENLELLDEAPAKVAEEKKTKTGGPSSAERKMLARMNAR